MANQLQQQEVDETVRWDPQMQSRIIEIASRLQETDFDHLSAQQMMEAAREIGIDPQYIRRAIAIAQAERTPPIVREVAGQRLRVRRRASFRRFLAAMLAPIGLGTLSFALKDFTGLAIVFGLILPAPLACLSGFLTGRKRVGFVLASLLILALAPTIYHLGIHEFYQNNAKNIYQWWFQNSARGNGKSMAMLYLLFGMPLAALLGLFGAWSRQRYFPDPEVEEA